MGNTFKKSSIMYSLSTRIWCFLLILHPSSQSLLPGCRPSHLPWLNSYSHVSCQTLRLWHQTDVVPLYFGPPSLLSEWALSLRRDWGRRAAPGPGGTTRNAGWAPLRERLCQSLCYYFWKIGWVEEAEACPEYLKEYPQANFPRSKLLLFSWEESKQLYSIFLCTL